MIDFNKKEALCGKKVISSRITKESRRIKKIKKVSKCNKLFLESLGFKTL